MKMISYLSCHHAPALWHILLQVLQLSLPLLPHIICRVLIGGFDYGHLKKQASNTEKVLCISAEVTHATPVAHSLLRLDRRPRLWPPLKASKQHRWCCAFLQKSQMPLLPHSLCHVLMEGLDYGHLWKQATQKRCRAFLQKSQMPLLPHIIWRISVGGSDYGHNLSKRERREDYSFMCSWK